MNVRLPLNHTSTGYVTSAVTLSVITAFRIGRMAGPVCVNFTSSTTGDGICPAWRIVTLDREPVTFTR